MQLRKVYLQASTIHFDCLIFHCHIPLNSSFHTYQRLGQKLYPLGNLHSGIRSSLIRVFLSKIFQEGGRFASKFIELLLLGHLLNHWRQFGTASQRPKEALITTIRNTTWEQIWHQQRGITFLSSTDLVTWHIYI